MTVLSMIKALKTPFFILMEFVWVVMQNFDSRNRKERLEVNNVSRDFVHGMYAPLYSKQKLKLLKQQEEPKRKQTRKLQGVPS